MANSDRVVNPTYIPAYEETIEALLDAQQHHLTDPTDSFFLDISPDYIALRFRMKVHPKDGDIDVIAAIFNQEQVYWCVRQTASSIYLANKWIDRFIGGMCFSYLAGCTNIEHIREAYKANFLGRLRTKQRTVTNENPQTIHL